MQQKYYNTKLITNSPIEVNASKVLTPYAFELLKKEIVQKELYAILQINDKRFIATEETLSCSCQQYEFSGILYKYILMRWRRESSLPCRNKVINPIRYNEKLHGVTIC
ncbi:hypothetical protein AMTRI_Chr10g229540 [Amborella trichopoda]